MGRQGCYVREEGGRGERESKDIYDEEGRQPRQNETRDSFQIPD